MRYSEEESLTSVLYYDKKVDWVWIDTNSRLPLDMHVVKKLKNFNTCLVCPERWGRPNDIIIYGQQMKEIGFWPDAIMTSISYIDAWERCARNT